ncbi:MAG: polymorphic toxin-type HINT domain-containing protein [Verrucomicrobiota bacterium]
MLDDGQGNLRWVASFYGYDDHGSVRYLTDAAGNVTDLYDYDAFGNLIQQGGNTPNLYLYAGEQFDPDLQLYYLRARYLNPDTGRFWTRDPFEGFLDDPLSLNGYLYANSDPVNNWDPSGFTTLAEVQQSSGISAQLRLTHQAPRLRKAAQAACRVVRTVDKAQNAYDTVQTARQLAAGVAAGAAAAGGVAGGGLPGAEVALMVIEEAFELRGLDVRRLRQFDLEEVLDSFDTPCFTAGTLVSTEQGLRPIEDLKVGDRVWALGQGTVEVGLKPITEVFRHEVTNLVVLTVGGEVIETTPEHPFWVRNEGWVRAGQLKAGDELLIRSGAWLPIIALEPRQGQFTVFNFEVEGWNTYYVGGCRVSVHNTWGTKPGVTPWQVGPANVLGSLQNPFDNIHIHHAGQAHALEQIIPGYNRQTGPAIAVPDTLHRKIPTRKGTCLGSARDQLAKDLRDLRRLGAPNKSLRELSSLNKSMFNKEFARPSRIK